MSIEATRSASPRTSATDPIAIGFVTAPGIPGRIGMTLCPGKHQADAQTGAWARDLEQDLTEIEALGPDFMLCLVEPHELAQLQVSALPDAAARQGFEWHHLPVPDGGVPDDAFETAWVYAGERLRQHLESGGDCVVFCKGGLGRTGMIAARLLVEVGVAPEDAIAAVRAARHSTIENSAQEAHVRYCRDLRADRDYRRRALGCLLGGAVGDALGYAVEFDSIERIRARFGPSGIQAPVLHQGLAIASDDTQMTLFTLEALLDCNLTGERDLHTVTERIRRAYLDWLTTQGRRTDSLPAGRLVDSPLLHALRAPGTTCLAALQAGGHGTPEHPLNDRKGCGGVMRVAPIGLITGLTREQRFELGVRAAALTHGHPSGYLPAGVLAALIGELLTGADLRAALDHIAPLLRAWPGCEETARAIDAALCAADATGTAPLDAITGLGGGWIAEEALAIGLYAALRGRDFPDVLRLAVNHSGDSDSTAAIAGQLYGAMHGIASLPHDWVASLDLREVLLDLVGAIAPAGTRAFRGQIAAR